MATNQPMVQTKEEQDYYVNNLDYFGWDWTRHDEYPEGVHHGHYTLYNNKVVAGWFDGAPVCFVGNTTYKTRPVGRTYADSLSE